MEIYKKGELTAYVGHGVARMSYGWLTNPSKEALINDGYEYYGEGYDQKEYAELVTKYIREKYTADDEFALINNYLLDKEKYEADYTAYQQYRAECKERAKKELGVTTEG